MASEAHAPGEPPDAGASALDALLRFLADDPAEAAAALEHRRRALVIAARGICARLGGRLHLPLDAEDIVQDTILRVAQMAVRRELTRTNVAALLRTTAYNVAREHVRRLSRHVAETAERMAPPSDDELRWGCEGRCFEAADETIRQLLHDYYTTSPEAMARRLGTNPNALRQRAFAARDRLRQCVDRCRKGQGVRV